MASKTPEALTKRLARVLGAERPPSAPEGVVRRLGLRDGALWKRLLRLKSLPAPDRSEQVLARWLFLSEVRRRHPEVLESLREDVDPAADRREALLAWQKGFCLTEPWIHAEASLTLEWWCWWRDLNGQVPLRWRFELEMVNQWTRRRDERLAWIEGTYTFQPPTISWSPPQESAREVIARCDAELQRAAADFAERVRGHEEYAALRRLSRERPALLQHCRWLIAKQVEGRSYPEIAERFGVHEGTVGREVRELARTLGLTLRDDRRGRPPGRKDSRPRINPSRW